MESGGGRGAGEVDATSQGPFSVVWFLEEEEEKKKEVLTTFLEHLGMFE